MSASTEQAFSIGALVRARGRDWVVQPESDPPLLVLKPLGGSDDDITGIHLDLEKVGQARFPDPDPTHLGDHRSCRLLRDAIRIGFRSSAGPFRSFGKIAIEPRPYQLVPLLLALKQDPVRILIADDVGIGKTIEAALIARELLDRGEIRRMAVLCPPHLAEQWQQELARFHLDAELVLPGTAARLERACRANQSVFDRYPVVIVSLDYIKADRRRYEFLERCPELVIVDEAHTCATAGGASGQRHLRNRLLQDLGKDETRHLILVTATPHSGKTQAFQSLLGLLDPSLAELPEDLSGPSNEAHRRTLSQYLVQRRRANIVEYLGEETPFPDREEMEIGYSLSPGYRALFRQALDWAKDWIEEPGTDQRKHRIRWWSALGLLRSIASSPAAALATFESRSSVDDAASPEAADAIGCRATLDSDEDDDSDLLDVAPGAELSDDEDARRALQDMALSARKLFGKPDLKAQAGLEIVTKLLLDGFQPIVFCRFIPTAEYVASFLQEKLPKGINVDWVTGDLPPAEREERVHQLTDKEGKHVLVCTDCLSEGINLQSQFQAVVHYDLSWSPTRHEQREGRVDRFLQPAKVVRAVTLYGVDNGIDGLVLDVLLRKHKAIRKATGISVPLPTSATDVAKALYEGLLLKGGKALDTDQLLWGGTEVEQLSENWTRAANRERASRAMFAQQAIKVDEVERELRDARRAIGSGLDVQRFFIDALRQHQALVQEKGDALVVDAAESPTALRDALGLRATPTFTASFAGGVPRAIPLSRTHPYVEGLAAHVLDSALEADEEARARRCGVIRTRRVETRTTLLLVRYRFHIESIRDDQQSRFLAEDLGVHAFEGAPDRARWLERETAESLLEAEPSGNIAPEQSRHFLTRALEGKQHWTVHLEQSAEKRAAELLEAHRRIRAEATRRGEQRGRQKIEPELPPDVLGLFVILPDGEA